MASDGIEAVFLETHNWGKSARFFQSLGYELEFETDHNSGQLRSNTAMTTVRDPDGRVWGLQAPLTGESPA